MRSSMRAEDAETVFMLRPEYQMQLKLPSLGCFNVAAAGRLTRFTHIKFFSYPRRPTKLLFKRSFILTLLMHVL
jgi:hypothetical protein